MSNRLHAVDDGDQSAGVDADPWDDIDHDPEAEAHAYQATGTSDDDHEKPKKSIATQLVELADEHYRLAITDQGDPVAFERNGANLAHPLHGGRLWLRAALARLYLESTGKAASSSALADALLVIEGRAQDADETHVSMEWRSDDGGAVALDLGTLDGRCVVVTSDGWQLAGRSPIPFMRSGLTAALPDPARTGHDLIGAPLGNIDPATWRVLVGWMATALIPGIPHPIVLFGGEQGTGKTTVARRLVDVLDPSTAPVRSVPLRPRPMDYRRVGLVGRRVGQPVGSACLAIGCTVPIGDRRRSRETTSLHRRRPSRDPIPTRRRPHRNRSRCVSRRLAEQFTPVDLDRINTTDRRTDAALADQWRNELPAILGTLLDLLVDILGVLPSIHLDELPRMADFARVLAALDRVRPVGTSGTSGTSNTLAHYLELTESVQANIVEDDPVAAAIAALVERVGTWEGTASQLLQRLAARSQAASWPDLPVPLVAGGASLQRCERSASKWTTIAQAGNGPSSSPVKRRPVINVPNAPNVPKPTNHRTQRCTSRPECASQRAQRATTGTNVPTNPQVRRLWHVRHVQHRFHLPTRSTPTITTTPRCSTPPLTRTTTRSCSAPRSPSADRRGPRGRDQPRPSPQQPPRPRPTERKPHD